MVDLNTSIHELFKLLTVSLEPERVEILIDRYIRNMTLQEIADNKGITRERVRQKEAKSILKYYDLLKFRGYKTDIDSISKRASSKLQIIEENIADNSNDSFKDKYYFLLKLSTKFPGSTYSIDRNRLLKNEVFISNDLNLETIMIDFKNFYKSDKVNMIKNINQKYNLNLDEQFLTNFVNITLLEESEMNSLFDLKIKNFESNRVERIERFFLDRGREATVQEIVEALNMEERSVRSALDLTENVVNIGKSVYGHVKHGFKQGTTQELILEYIKLNSPVSLFKIQRYIKSERVVQDKSVNVYLQNLKNKGMIEKIDDEFHYIEGSNPPKVTVIKEKRPVKNYLDNFKEIFRYKVNDNKEIVVGDGGDFYRIGEFIYTNKYEGFTKSGIVIRKDLIETFLENLMATLKTNVETRIPWNNIAGAELVIRKEEKIPSSGDYYIDMRQYITAKNFEGYTKKGLRMDEVILLEFLGKFVDALKDFGNSK